LKGPPFHISEKSGRGVPRIVHEYGQQAFEFKDNAIVVTLPLVKREQSLEISEKQPEKSPEKQPEETRSAKIEMRVAAVLDLIRNDPTLSRAAIARKLEITDSQARTAIDKLKERGKIHREGSDTDGKWIID
jgi:predicted HTH transcriptional regulator